MGGAASSSACVCPAIFIHPIASLQPLRPHPPPPGPLRMRPSIWSEMPEDVMERVLAFLPPLSFIRLRCVCKRWSLLLCDSPRFLDLRRHLSPSSSSSSSPFVATMEPPPSRSHPWTQITIHPTPFLNFVCRASSGGLLFCSWGAHSQHYVVCNPATKAWRDLPPLPLSKEHGQHKQHNFRFVPGLVALVADNSTSHYKVMITGQLYERRTIQERDFDHWFLEVGADADDHWVPLDGNATHHCNTFVYESITGSWKVTSRLRPGFVLPHSTHEICATFWNGTLVWRSHTRNHACLIMYHIEDDSWSSVDTLNSPPCSLLSQLMEHNGDLLIVGVDETTCTIIIWKLEPTQLLWREMDRYVILAELSRFPGAHALGIQCVKGHELIHITAYLANFRRVGVYDLTGKVWQWLPVCSLSTSIFPGDISVTDVPFEPRQGFRGVYFPFEVKLEAVP